MLPTNKRNRDEYSSTSRETITLPVQNVVAKSLPHILEYLKQLIKDTNDVNQYYPVVVGSRAAAYCLPSFRPPEDWDLIATPTQAFKIIESLQASSLTAEARVLLIKQPLDKNVVRRKPETPEIQEKLANLPGCLYKIHGNIKEVKFEIEITPVNKEGFMFQQCSATRIFSICNSGDDQSYLDFPIGTKKCVVASLEILETLKSSHINWPAYFPKHIADLHTLRALILPANSNVNMGIHADKKKPLTSPERTPELEDLLLTRTLETEAFRGTPGAHINLNVSNEDFLGRDDDLFVTRHIPHDDVHLLVKYGDIPIYDQLKTDSSKAMVSRKLFQEAPYDTQLKCVKEEAMVIALERFLLPKLASDPSSAYKSALIRICTTLTKGWFRQFAIDNFPRLAVCDKDLITIRDEILKKHPLPPLQKVDPRDLLKQSVTTLEDRVVLQKLIPLTRSSSVNEAKTIANKFKRSRHAVHKEDDSSENEGSDEDMNSDEYSSDEDYGRRDRDSRENYWIINSSNSDNPPLFVSFINKSKFSGEDCLPSFGFSATLSVQPLNSYTDLSHLECKLWKQKNKRDIFPFQMISVYVSSTASGGSWGGEDIWSEQAIKTHHVQDSILRSLDVEDLTEDLFMKYVIAVVQPKLLYNGDTPLKVDVMRAKSNGTIPLKPENHLWYDLWKYRKYY